MKMYQATPTLWLPEGVTTDTMYKGDAMMDQVMEVCGVNDFIPESESRSKPTATVWVPRDGQRIPVRDMGDQHLINTIRMLRRKAPFMMMNELRQMDRYIRDAPDGAAMGCESEADALINLSDDEYLSRTLPTFPALLAEAEKRGLEV